MMHDFGYFEEDYPVSASEMRLWRRIMRYALPHWRGITTAIMLSLIITAASLAVPYLVKIAIDQFIVNQELPTQLRLEKLAGMAFIFIILISCEFLANFLQVILLEWTGQNIMHRMRQHLFGHLLSLDMPFFNQHPIGRLVTRLTNDIQNMHEMFTSVIVTIFNDFARIIGILIILFWMNWRLALVMTLLIPIMFVNTIWFSRLARGAFREIRTQLARINSFLQETLSGVNIIQLFLREMETNHRFEKLNASYYDSTMRQIKIFGIFMPLIEFMSTVAVALIIWHGGGDIIRGNMTLGVLVAFLSYMRLFFQPLRELSQNYSIVQSSIASAERIFQLLDSRSSLEPSAVSPFNQDINKEIQGRIEFTNVTFGYQKDQPVVDHISLVIQPGETLAIVGATGAGKTTIINLLERFYDPQEGQITIDGINLRDFDIKTLRRTIGLVMQDVFIVPDTLKNNMLLDKKLSSKQLQKVIAGAQLEKLISQLPKGLDTRIGDGGMGLSAGQKQLLAFARILVRDPRILILDEATSNIDSETEQSVEQVIAATLANRTGIVIAHRLSTIRRADRIVVMDHGKIIQEGTHAELMRIPGLYHYLQTLQNNGSTQTHPHERMLKSDGIAEPDLVK